MIRQLAYRSRATYVFDANDIVRLLLAAREHNARDGITGLLVHRGGGFVQLIEGAADRVEALYARIARDPRHDAIERLLSRDTGTRLLPRWSMAYAGAPLGDDGRAAFAGLSPEADALQRLSAAPADDAAARILRDALRAGAGAGGTMRGHES